MSKDLSFEWLKASNDDLLVIFEIINNENLTHIVAFHAQQCIEKSLKALMEFNNIEVPRKHDLVVLYKLIPSLIHIDNMDILDSLNSLYIDSRYPGDLGLLPNGKPTLEEAQEFYQFANDIFDRIKSKIN